MSRRRLVIVGNGMAGARLAEHLVTPTRMPDLDIVMFGDEPGGSYNRILLSGVLAGTHAGPDIVTHPVEWYAAHGIVLYTSTRVDRVDLDRRTVLATNGLHERFDTLVFATGSSPLLPAIDGLLARDGSLVGGAFVFRTVEDCARMAVAASEGRRAVVIGGGLLGLEAARGLLSHGLTVTVVHLNPRVMNGQLDGAGAEILQRRLEALGLRILTGRTTARVVGTRTVEAVRLGDGTTLRCDVLVIAAGVRPNAQLARDAGLLVDRGIVVSDDLSCPGVSDVYAIGDCAEHEGRLYGLVAPAWEQAAVLADRLTRRRVDAAYTGSRPATKLKVAGCDVAVMGDCEPDEDDEVVTYSEPARGIYSRVLVRENTVAGAILIGLPAAVPSVVQRFLDRAPAPSDRSDLLFPPSGDGPALSVEQIPDTARICDCNAVRKEQIVEAVLGGARGLRTVCELTRAGTGCGSCRPEVQRIVDFTCRRLGNGDAVLENAGPDLATGGAHASV